VRLSRRAKRRLIVLIGTGAILCAGAVMFRAIQSAQRQSMIAQSRVDGLRAHDVGDFRLALERLAYFIQFDKSDVEVMLAFADARQHIEQSNGQHLFEAAAYYKTALDLIDAQPDLPDRAALKIQSQRKLLGIRGRLGQRFELLQLADQILSEHPEDIEALTAKARALYTDRQFDQAMPVAQELIRLQPDNTEWRQLELGLMRAKGDDEQSILAKCDAWVDAWQGDGRFHLVKAGWLAEFGRIPEARQIATQAAALGADDLTVLQRMLALLDALAMRDVAVSVIGDAKLKFPGEQWVRQAAIRRYWLAQQLDRALAEIASAEADFVTLNAEMVRLKALVTLASDRLEDSRVAANELLGDLTDPVDDADRSWARALLTRINKGQTGWREQVDACRSALLHEQTDPVLHYLLGEACHGLGEQALALDAYRQAWSLEPNWLAAGIDYARVLLEVGRDDEALRVADMVLTRAPERSLPIFKLYAQAALAVQESGGSVTLATGLSTPRLDVVALLRAMHEQFPSDREAVVLLARALLLGGETDEAHRAIQDYAARADADADALIELSRLCRRYELELADAMLDRAEQVAGLSIPVAFERATILAESGDVASGLELIDHALAASSAEAGSARFSPDILARQRAAFMVRYQHPEARTAIQSLLEQFPQSVPAQIFAMVEAEARRDRELMRAAIDNLSKALGERSPQVRLAEASFLLRFEPEKPASLAQANAIVSSALLQSPESLSALTLMAQAIMAGSAPSPDRAVEHLRKAVDLYPGQVELYPRLITLLQGQGDFETASRYLAQFGRMSQRDAALRWAELELLQSQGDLEGALRRAAALLADAEVSEVEQLAYANLALRAGRVADAEQIFDRLLAAPVPSPIVLAQAAEFYARTRRFDAGMKLLERIDESHAAESGEPVAPRSLLIGVYCRRYGQLPDALRWLQQATTEHPQSPDAWNQLAQTYLELDQQTEARDAVVTGLKHDPEHTGLRMTMALASLDLPESQRQKALEDLRAVARPNDDLVAALEFLNRVPMTQAGFAPRPEDFKAATALVESHSTFLPAWLLAISLHSDAGQPNEAIALARRAVSRFPSRAEPAQWATSLLASAGRWEEALVEAREWRARSLEDTMAADIMSASILLELNRSIDALQLISPFVKRLDEDPTEHAERLGVYLRALVATGDVQEATRRMSPLLPTNLRFRQLWLRVTRSMKPADAYQALQLVEPSMAADPTELLLLATEWAQLARREACSNCVAEATELAERAAQANPELHADAELVLASIAEISGDLSTAERRYRQALERNPNSALALNNLAAILARSPDTAPEALALATRVAQLMPQDPDVLDTYAQALIGVERHSEAEQALRKALTIRPADVGCTLNLAEALIGQGRHDDAQTMLRDAEGLMQKSGTLSPRHVERLDGLRQRLQSAQADESGSAAELR
jgi:tetratricopeptide (TPR) repeat protein